MKKIEQWIPVVTVVAGAMMVALVVGSCSSTPSGPPSVQDDICSIFAQRPKWREAAYESALRWGAPVEVQMAIIWKESNFQAQAKTRRKHVLWVIPAGRESSAFGYAQAIDSTWDWYREETGNTGADRDDFDDAADFVGWYMAKSMISNGIQMNDAFAHYLNYHEGHAGYRRGDWRNEDSLKQAATKVADQAAHYRGQLHHCS
jgi:hypothetical protein